MTVKASPFRHSRRPRTCVGKRTPILRERVSTLDRGRIIRCSAWFVGRVSTLANLLLVPLGIQSTGVRGWMIDRSWSWISWMGANARQSSFTYRRCETTFARARNHMARIITGLVLVAGLAFPNDRFYVEPSACRWVACWLGESFRMLWWQAGQPRPPGGGRASCL